MVRVVKTERVFCPTCLSVTDCTVGQTVDQYVWTCTVCGRVADEDWNQHFDDYDETNSGFWIPSTQRCGRAPGEIYIT